ncbi:MULTISPECIES: hypothetical protein [Amniculibacterium]|jgi:hypothetical protein|uniref:hypothetical protein n=1 Tax=Amniculibacterium TaxID=2715289 RepID=UPI000F5A3BA4|nr:MULTISPECIES: hypothetical protein [Amniculibacterium]
MAKYNDLKEVRGSIDDLVFYNLNGVPVVRKKSGFSTEAFANNPNYKKVKENSTEFGHCSKASKMIRMAVATFVENCGDKVMYQKFTKVMTNIKDLDKTSPRGQRRIELGLKSDEAQQLLRQFQFGEIPNLSKVAVMDIGLFNDSIAINQVADEAVLIHLNADFNNYVVKNTEKTYPLKGKNNLIEIEKQDENSLKLLFLVLKKKGNITHVGFI